MVRCSGAGGGCRCDAVAFLRGQPFCADHLHKQIDAQLMVEQEIAARLARRREIAIEVVPAR